MKRTKKKMESVIIKTGIKGFDELIEGGFKEGKIILLSGTPGTGKSIFAMEYLYNGASKFGERGLYVTLEEKKDALINQAMQFGWDFKELEKKGLLEVMEIGIKSITERTVQDIVRKAKKGKIRRLVLDSISSLAINTPTTYLKTSELTEMAVKKFVYGFINDLRQLKETTSLIISQTVDGQISSDGVSEFVCDGIIYIMYEAIAGQYTRSLMIRKMRETRNNPDIHPMEITHKGIVVHPGLGES
ncbi:hypothetical protein D6764_01595 [Candidatus Woesearchaeota archaeon]|nr:MAG: hypothetical protein D6764_01595 [Candidatus Woesearchaeota archaeon]